MALRQDYLIPVGLFKKTRKFVAGHISGKKFIGEILVWLNVPFANPCCDNASDQSPVRYNSTTSKLQYFNKTTEVWTDVPTAVLNPA